MISLSKLLNPTDDEEKIETKTNDEKEIIEEKKVESNDVEIVVENKKRKFVTLEPTLIYNLPETKIDIPTSPPVLPKDLALDKKKKERLIKKSSLLTDITPLLILPQKVAAERLGLSESMLCKRFKERTNKKWPYRLLRKIEREIAICKSKTEISKLMQQRDECLAPVSIRVRRYRTQNEINNFNFDFESENEDD